MVKILAIGDFHGKFPEKLKKKIEKENLDIILCTGDFANADKIRKIIFKNWQNKKWHEIIGLKKAAKLEKESFNSGLEVLKQLNKLGKKIYIIFGNLDFYKDSETSEPDSIMPGFYEDKIKKLKNIILIDRKKRKINNIDVIGHGKYVDVTEFIKNPIDKDKKSQKRRLKRYKGSEKKLFKLFSEFKLKKFILVTHYTPFNCLDEVKYKQSPMYKKHVGFEPYNKIIKKYKPSLVICGHMHENQGKCKIKQTLVINPGAAQEGKAAIIDFNEKKGKVKKIEFIK